MTPLKRYVIFLFLISLSISYGQKKSTKGIVLLNELIAKKDYVHANKEVQFQIKELFQRKLLDSLKYYPYYLGKITLENSNTSNAILKAETFLENLRKAGATKRTLYNSYLNLTNFYDEIGDLNRSLELTKESLKTIQMVGDATQEEIGKTIYNLGVCHLSLGTINTAKKHFIDALKVYEAYPQTTSQNLSDGYNAMGAIMWMSTQLDSAKFYYHKGINILAQENTNQIKNLFTATSIRSNISLLEQALGNLSDALENQQNVISNYNKVINTTKDIELKEKARQNRLIAIYNLSIFYNEIGNLDKAKEFILYSYQLAQKLLDPSDPELPQYEIALAEIELSLQNHDQAIQNAKSGLQGLQDLNVDDPLWKAKAVSVLASANAYKGNNNDALQNFKNGEILFNEALGNSFSAEFLQLLRSKSFFLVETNQNQEAINTILKGYNYLREIDEEENLAYFKIVRDIAEIYFRIGNYQEALKWSNRGIALIERKKENPQNVLDSVQLNFVKPAVLLTKVKSIYELESNPNKSFIEQLLPILREATTILEQRKTTTLTGTDTNQLNQEYRTINDFAKKLYLELFMLTNNKDYLDQIISFHESAIYSTIRNKLNLEHSIKFAGIPEKVLLRENELKDKLSNSLKNPSESVDNYFKINEQWQLFLDSLKLAYPGYYKMRYATLEQSIYAITQKTPPNTTIIRYFFIDKMLYVLIINEKTKELIPLNFLGSDEKIQLLSNFSTSTEAISKASTLLYNQLWKPFENLVNTENIIIFPDQELFNLSFELLSPKPFSSFKELTSKSLLGKHNISYNYSLFLLDKEERVLKFKDDFVAFAPEFKSEMKKSYELAIQDSIYLDQTYLTLLPQPFSSELAKKYGSHFKGSSFLNQNASKQLFTKNAGEHKIIHIGTHAESNNVNPELSRLVFAKNVSDSTNINDNYLYTYEIYNENLSSNLAILTACETGKPTYQPGEGMISLAHAFNYAGSESILTSLWQIDEQSSTQIIEYFYTYLEEGLPKDEALKNAKLDYLKNAEGRTLHPQYWAGLVLMGDTSPILLDSNNMLWWVLASLGLVIGFLLFFIVKKKSSSFFGNKP